MDFSVFAMYLHLFNFDALLIFPVLGKGRDYEVLYIQAQVNYRSSS